MARSPKIRKKKSFMFTTKHHSFTGILGLVLFVLAFGVLVTSVSFAFKNRGEVETAFGYYGFLSALLNLIGLFGGIVGVRERDAFVIAPWIAIGGNAFSLACWALLLLLSAV